MVKKKKKPEIETPSQEFKCEACGIDLETVEACWIGTDDDGKVKFMTGKQPKIYGYPTSPAEAYEVALEQCTKQVESCTAQLDEANNVLAKVKKLKP